MRNKGYTVPFFLILILFVLIVPVYYWVKTNNFNFSSSKNIRGATSVGSVQAHPGISVSVTSKSSTWDLVEYLCADLDECTESLNSGRRLGTVSGGETDLHDVVIEYTNEWNDYKYIKYFVRSGWYATERPFKVIDLGSAPGSKVYNLVDGNNEYDVVISPIAELSAKFYASAHFSDL